ncbi:hypothetical protein [Tenacibaculum aiptasiae]|uniref:hypothetical protein n=1 Tax=Tenacibaculum aiptasiae TaxID=426481 RepID=UPI00232AD83D|nr:hypothetical protein [Tenacibaculum aiptasiae]
MVLKNSILLIASIFLFSCVEKKSSLCIDKVKLKRFYNRPAPDVITFFVKNNELLNSSLVENLDKYYFLKGADTLGYGNHFRFYNKDNNIKIVLFSSSFMNQKDTSFIKRQLAEGELLLNFVNNDKLYLGLCQEE